MDERAALSFLTEEIDPAGDDAAVIEGLVLTTDMLHESTDFPAGTTRFTAGWRAVGASLSDVAAMGAKAIAAVAVYAAPRFDRDDVRSFVEGARDVSELTGATYVGGDLDHHEEFTVATTVVGRTDSPVFRSGARPGDAVCVTGTLGRTAAGLRCFDTGEVERGNELFRFRPRIESGLALGNAATAMIDSSDGLARSLHQLGAASDCGFAIESDSVPIDDALLADGSEAAVELATTVGEDFELVATIPPDRIEAVRDQTATPITRIGTTTEAKRGITIDGDPLPDSGYTHGS